MQVVRITDGKSTVKVKLWDRPNITAKAGEKFAAVAVRGTKGFSGIAHKGDETYKDKTETVIEVRKTAAVMISGRQIGETPIPEDAPLDEETKAVPAPAKAAPAKAQQSQASAPRQTAPAAPKNPRSEFKRAIGRAMNAQSLITSATDILAEEYLAKHGEQMPVELYVATIGRMFIELRGSISTLDHELSADLVAAKASLDARRNAGGAR
jgi:hypothetical protein